MSVRLTSLQRRALATLVQQIDLCNTRSVSATYIAVLLDAHATEVLTALRTLSRLGYVDERRVNGHPAGFVPTRKGRGAAR